MDLGRGPGRERHHKQWEEPEQKPRDWKAGVCPGSSMQLHLALEEVRKIGKNAVSRPILTGERRSWALAEPCERLSGST